MVIVLGVVTASGIAQHGANRRIGFQRGVNFTAEDRDGYSAEVARPMLVKLCDYGVNSVALVPYGFTPRGKAIVRFGGGWETDEGIEAVALVAHELGMKVLLKPQLWVHPGYPGELDFPSAAERAEWFAQYQRYIEHQAGLATKIHADVFSIGVELAKLTCYEDAWRRLIRSVRQIYRGPITYAAAQGHDFDNIRFWDALDYIGLNDYYPLPDNLSAGAIADRIGAVATKYGRPVLITEIGFSSYAAPQTEPWAESPRRVAPEDQARCYEAIFRAFYARPWLAGLYWWKVGTNGYGGPTDGSHTPWGKPAMEVLKKWYTSGKR